MKRSIKNIVFDLGGVLFEINYEETFIRLGEILKKDLMPGSWPDDFEQLVIKYETGSINTETFIWNLQRMCPGITPHPIKIVKAWNAMLIGWYEGIQDLLVELKADYSLYLLSNINELHYEFLERSFDDKSGMSKFLKAFHGTAFSHLIGHRKPQPSAFLYLVEKYGIVPSDTLYVDDFEANVQAAEVLGFKGVHHIRHNSIIREIFSHL